ncbi:MAG: type II toxin-antitoxin system RelE/ParE family toxin [Sterolibacterium sp.]
MSRIVVTPGAARGLERCRQFLADKSPAASKRAAQAIRKQFDVLETQPGVGRPLEDEPDLRELIISFGDSGYVALYHYEHQTDCVLLLAFRHQKEAGY